MGSGSRTTSCAATGRTGPRIKETVTNALVKENRFRRAPMVSVSNLISLIKGPSYLGSHDGELTAQDRSIANFLPHFSHRIAILRIQGYVSQIA